MSIINPFVLFVAQKHIFYLLRRNLNATFYVLFLLLTNHNMASEVFLTYIRVKI